MSWLKHRCWYCGHVSRAVVFIVSQVPAVYQCRDGVMCQARRDMRYGDAVGSTGEAT